MQRTISGLLALLGALALPAWAGDVITTTPDQGSFGTLVTLELDADPGQKQPKVLLVRHDGKSFTLAVEGWQGGRTLTARLPKKGKLTAGSYDLRVEPKGNGAPSEPFTASAAFDVMPPRILSVDDDSPQPGQSVILKVEHLGARKGSVRIWNMKAKIVDWNPGSDGLGTLEVKLPKNLAACQAPVILASHLGMTSLPGGLTIQGGAAMPGTCGQDGATLVAGKALWSSPAAFHAEGFGSSGGSVLSVQIPVSKKKHQGLLSFSIALDGVAGAGPFAVDAPLGLPVFTSGGKCWDWAPGDAFIVRGSPLGGGQYALQLDVGLGHGKKRMHFSGFSVSRLGSPEPTPGAAMTFGGQPAELTFLEPGLDDSYGDTSIWIDMTMRLCGQSFDIIVTADRYAETWNPAAGPMVFVAEEICVLITDGDGNDWDQSWLADGDAAFTIRRLAGGNRYEATMSATLASESGLTDLAFTATVAADASDWEQDDY